MSTVIFHILFVLKIEENILFTLNPVLFCILMCCLFSWPLEVCLRTFTLFIPLFSVNRAFNKS